MSETINHKWYARSSQIGLLMTKGRGKEPFGETSKKAILEACLFNKYQVQKTIQSRYLDKGIINENESLEMLNKAMGWDLKLDQIQKERKYNEWITGEPDLVVPGKILADVKSSYDHSTFPWVADLSDLKKHNKNYWFQMQSYMWLFDFEESYLAYCLTDHPAFQINDEVQRRSWRAMAYPENGDKNMDLIEDEIREQVTRELTYPQIPKEKRIRIFKVQRDNEAIEQIKERVEEARLIYQSIYNTI